jgi:outer membrane receptor protein involved in Fe transport
MHSSYEVNERVQMYAHIVNLTNRQYSTFGELGDPTGIGTPGIPPDADTNDPRVDNRFVSPAQPFSVYAGVRIRY